MVFLILLVCASFSSLPDRSSFFSPSSFCYAKYVIIRLPIVKVMDFMFPRWTRRESARSIDGKTYENRSKWVENYAKEIKVYWLELRAERSSAKWSDRDFHWGDHKPGRRHTKEMGGNTQNIIIVFFSAFSLSSYKITFHTIIVIQNIISIFCAYYNMIW